MSRFTIIISDFAAEAARIGSTPAALEAQARREIAEVFGNNFALRRYPREKTTIRLHFTHAEEDYIVFPLTAGTWCIETSYAEPPCPPYPIVFTARATALIVNLGWKIDSIEHAARCALKSAHPRGLRLLRFPSPHRRGRFQGLLGRRRQGGDRSGRLVARDVRGMRLRRGGPSAPRAEI
jgi:hypothetical protein